MWKITASLHRVLNTLRVETQFSFYNFMNCSVFWHNLSCVGSAGDACDFSFNRSYILCMSVCK